MTGKIPSGDLRVPVCSESDSAAPENEYHKYWKKKEYLFLVIFEDKVPIKPKHKNLQTPSPASEIEAQDLLLRIIHLKESVTFSLTFHPQFLD